MTFGDTHIKNAKRKQKKTICVHCKTEMRDDKNIGYYCPNNKCKVNKKTKDNQRQLNKSFLFSIILITILLALVITAIYIQFYFIPNSEPIPPLPENHMSPL